jgi:putative ABC transport system substrate-binding protein
MTPITNPNLSKSRETASLSWVFPTAPLVMILIVLAAAFPSAIMAGGRTVSVQSVSISLYEEAIDGFATVCTLPMERLLVSAKHSLSMNERIRRLEPDLILAVGYDALKSLDDIHDIPIVFVMMLCPDCELLTSTNITGVNMLSSPGVQLGSIREVLPDVRSLGVLFNPEETGQFVETASMAAGSLGIDILGVPVSTAREVPGKLAGIRDQAEMIWMIPDVTVITSQTIEFFLLFSMENRIPLAAFSEKYVDMGAFMAFGLDPGDMGRQAGDMANLILAGKSPCEVPVQNARKVTVTVNRTLAKKFGVRIDETMLETVKFVE